MFNCVFFCSPNDCTNQGKCVGHQCVCKGDWIAKDCSVHACPENCGAGEGRGICSKEHCRCLNVCHDGCSICRLITRNTVLLLIIVTNFYFILLKGYSGKACSLHAINPKVNEWHYLASAYSGLTPRAAHTAVYIEESDALYVYGGYDLNSILGSLQVYVYAFKQFCYLRMQHIPLLIIHLHLNRYTNLTTASGRTNGAYPCEAVIFPPKWTIHY